MTNQELEKCINEYGRDIFSFCKYLTCNEMNAEELYQDTFLKASELRGKMDIHSNPKSYLLSIALRLWRNKKRKHGWRSRIATIHSLESVQDAAGDLSGDMEDRIVAEEERRMVRNAINKLPEKLRIVTLLYYMEELSTVEIASVIKIPKGTVLSRLHQARKILRVELEDVFHDK